MQKIMTIVIAVFGLFVIGYIAVLTTTYAQTNAFSLSILHEVRETKSFDRFVKYQTVLFKELEVDETTDYKIGIFHVITQIEQRYQKQLLITIVPLDDVTYAETRLDESDETQFLIKTENNEIVFDTKTHESYQNNALSFGYAEDQIGFIFIGFTPNNSQIDWSYTVESFDYFGQLIAAQTITFEMIEYDEVNLNIYEDAGYEAGYTTEEISGMINLDQKVLQAAMLYVGIYLVIVIGGFGLFYMIKKYRRLRR